MIPQIIKIYKPILLIIFNTIIEQTIKMIMLYYINQLLIKQKKPLIQAIKFQKNLQMLDYSFNSDQHGRNLTKLQQSILKQYKRLNFGEDTIQYSINSLNYSDLPQNFPEELNNKNTKCLRLSSCGFFQMLTYSVFEFLLAKKSPEKDFIIKKLRKKITEKDFMEDSPSTKGLLLKGLKMMFDYAQLRKNQKPIAHCMWKNDSMPAFTQFWKSLLSKLSVRNIVTADNSKALDVGLFQILADFLQINFNIFYQNNNDNNVQFDNQIYYSRRKETQLKLSLVVFSNDKNKKKQCSRIMNTSSMTQKNSFIQSLEWNYIILEDTAQFYRSELQKQNISQIHRVDDSVEQGKQEIMRLFKSKTKSQLNYNPQKKDPHQNEQGLSPSNLCIKNIKGIQGLQTTRTKKSTITTYRKTQNKSNNNSLRQKTSSFDTQQNLEMIRYTMIQGDQLVNKMKNYCEALTSKN